MNCDYCFINCIFCHNPMELNSSNNSAACRASRECIEAYVGCYYRKPVSIDNITQLWFEARYDNKRYHINWFAKDGGIYEIVGEIEPPFDPESESVSINYIWKDVAKFRCSHPILTPKNFKDKFPTIVTFS